MVLLKINLAFTIKTKSNVTIYLNMKRAKLEVYYGPMFSGKSALMIKEIFSNIDKSKLVFKPKGDVRSEMVYTREGIEFAAIGIENTRDILDHIQDWIEIVFIDELHFFGDELYDVVVEILDRGIDVTLAGLNTDFRIEEFPVAKKLIILADKAIKLRATCHICGKGSDWTARYLNGKPDSKDSETIISDKSTDTIEYKTLCSNCHPFSKEK